MDDDALGGLALIVAIAIVAVIVGWLVVLYKLARWAAEHPREAAQMALVTAAIVTAPLWLPAAAVAALVLVLARDLVVWAWAYAPRRLTERGMVVVWVAVVPPVAAVCWSVLVGAAVALLGLPAPEALVYRGLSTLAFVASYYYGYLELPPKHPNWPYFLAAQELMRLDLRLAWGEQWLALRLWAIARRQQVEQSLRGSAR